MNENRQKIVKLTDGQIDSIIKGELDVGIRVGFELEFQKLDGKDKTQHVHECDCKGVPDKELMDLAALNKLEKEFHAHYQDHLNSTKAGKTKAESQVRAAFDTLPVGSDRDALLAALSNAVPESSYKAISAFLDKIDTITVARITAGLNPNDYIKKKCTCADTSSFGAMKKKLKIPEDTQIKDDGSVKGGEITTIGPKTVKECLDASKYLFENNKLTIDKGCSYHVHFSMVGMRHTYGTAMQAEAIRYMAEQAALGLVPEFIQKRFEEFRYYVPRLDNDKYSFLNFNDDYDTWEARFFGNVKTIEEAEWCYRTLIKMIRHCYSVLEGETPSLRRIIADATGMSHKPSQIDLVEFMDSYGAKLLRNEASLNTIIAKLAADKDTLIDQDTEGVA